MDRKQVVNEHQGIDLDTIEDVMKRIKHNDNPENSDPIQQEEVMRIADDVLELIEHVREDGLLDRVAAARKDMALDQEAAEAILPSQQ